MPTPDDDFKAALEKKVAENQRDLKIISAQRDELRTLGPGSCVMCVTGAEVLHLLQAKLAAFDASRSCAHTLADLTGFCARLPPDVLYDALGAVRTAGLSDVTLRMVAEARAHAEKELLADNKRSLATLDSQRAQLARLGEGACVLCLTLAEVTLLLDAKVASFDASPTSADARAALEDFCARLPRQLLHDALQKIRTYPLGLVTLQVLRDCQGKATE
ncbi:uncharacterized protein LOC62_06G008576 [Vanrija pseudolonga]|uniref:Uncharacterized protein n=1 Tax=Vanrija pseudolonga TaxID=143232 RepID=A0AAF1BKU3_9TREE|nr:hypothetical protein LOC62_06G008576 [Vanrija pseudolonga]